MSSTELVNSRTISQEQLWPYTDWSEIYGDLNNMLADLTHECNEHIAELESGTYCGRPISPEYASEQALGYRQEIEAFEKLDINDSEAVLRVMRLHQKRKNAASDFIDGRTREAGADSLET